MNEKIAYVIDDRPDQRRVFTRCAERCGYVVQEFTSVQAALDHMRYDPATGALDRLPAVIVTDNDTGPGPKGVDLLRIARGRGVGLVMASGDATAEEVLEAGGPGARLLQKGSFGLEEFQSALAGAVQAAMFDRLGLNQGEGRSVT